MDFTVIQAIAEKKREEGERLIREAAEWETMTRLLENPEMRKAMIEQLGVQVETPKTPVKKSPPKKKTKAPSGASFVNLKNFMLGRKNAPVTVKEILANVEISESMAKHLTGKTGAFEKASTNEKREALYCMTPTAYEQAQQS